MSEHTYSVYVDDKRYARDMDLTTALMLVETLFTKWYNEDHLAITIRRDDDLMNTISIEKTETMYN